MKKILITRKLLKENEEKLRQGKGVEGEVKVEGERQGQEGQGQEGQGQEGQGQEGQKESKVVAVSAQTCFVTQGSWVVRFVGV